MTKIKGLLVIYFMYTAVTYPVYCGVSSKMDFGNEEDALTTVISNSTKSDGDDDDVEVNHTIMLSTRLKNNNRRGLHGINDDGDGTLTYNIGRTERPRKLDTAEVPVINGYMAVDTTEIRTPDSRFKTKIYPDAVFINRNVRDEYDIYPNIATNPTQWKPSSFFNNINWLSTDTNGGNFNNIGRRIDTPVYQSPEKTHRRITDDGMREFYCKRCRELSEGRGQKGCIQQRSNPWNYQQTTTPKIKIDGKLAKLN